MPLFATENYGCTKKMLAICVQYCKIRSGIHFFRIKIARFESI